MASTNFLRSDQADIATGLLTFTNGFTSNASSTIANLTTDTATTTTLVVNGESLTDLTGNGLVNNSGVLTVDASAFLGAFASTTDFDTSAELAAILTDETGTGLVVFNNAPTFLGTIDAVSADFSSTLTMTGSAANIALESNFLSGDGDDEGIFVDGSGNVGVGTSSPASTLDVWGGVRIGSSLTGLTANTSSDDLVIEGNGDIGLSFLTGASDGQAINFGRPGNVSRGSITYNHSGDFMQIDQGSRGIFLRSDSIGFGTDSNADFAFEIEMPSSGNGFFGITNVSDGDMFTIDLSGNVGIGTSSPASTLDVWGSARFGTASTPALLVDAANNQTIIGTTTAYDAGNTGLYLEDAAIGFRNSNRLDRPAWLSINSLGYLNFEGTLFRFLRQGNNVAEIGSTGLRINADNDNSFDLVANTQNVSNMLFVDASADMVAIGTSTPTQFFTIAGDTFIEGALLDSTESAGTDGMVFQTTGVGTRWVATSSLGIDNSIAPDSLDFTDFSDSLTIDANTVVDTFSNGYFEFDGGTAQARFGGSISLIDTGFTLDGTDGLSLVNGVVEVPNGTASAPTFTFGTDTNTGLFRSAADTLSFSTGGTERMVVSAAGNVGIGTTTPSSALTVVGGISASADSGSNNEFFGQGATASGSFGDDNTLIGANTSLTAGINGENVLIGAGVSSTAGGGRATVIGANTTNSGSRSVVIGQGLNNTTDDAVVIGSGASASNGSLISIGTNAVANEVDSIAFGWGVTTDAPAEIVFGSRENATVTPSIRLMGSTNQFTGRNLFSVTTDWLDDTDGSRRGQVVFNAFDTTTRPFLQADTTGSAVTTSFIGGSVGIGTTTPSSLLTVAGDTYISGALLDSTNSAGTDGMVLQTTGSGTEWVATSTLGIGGGPSVSFGADNQIPFTNSGGTDFDYSSGLTYDGSSLSVDGEIDIIDLDAGISFGGTRFFYATSTNDSLAIGEFTGGAGTNGLRNIAIGSSAMTFNSSGDDNVAIGNSALSQSNLNSSFNTAIGNAARVYGGGQYNASLGYSAGRGDSSAYTSLGGVYVGAETGFSLDGLDIDNNTFIGYRAGRSVSTGENNIILGALTGSDLTTGSNNIIIGYDVEAPLNTGSNQLNIGNFIFGTDINGTGTTLSTGNIGISTSTPSQTLTVDGDIFATGIIYDSTESAGTDGMVLQTTGVGTQWVATSSLGIGGSIAPDSLDFNDFADGTLTMDSNFDIETTGSYRFSIRNDTSTGEKIEMALDAIEISSSNTTVRGEAGILDLAFGFSNNEILLANVIDEGIIIDSQGNVEITELLQVSGGVSGTSGYAGTFLNDGNNINRQGLLVQAGLDNAFSTGPSTLIQFNDGDGSDMGDISFGGDALRLNSGGGVSELILGASGTDYINILAGTGVSISDTLVLDQGVLGTGGFAFSGDSNTGIFRSAADEITFSTAGSDRFIVDSAGSVGIGTSTPSSLLTVAGDAYISGALLDSTNSAGTDGMVLQTTGVGTQWVATSSLGIGGGSSVSFGLDNQIPYTNSGTDDFDYSASFRFDGGGLIVNQINGSILTDLELGGGTNNQLTLSGTFSAGNINATWNEGFEMGGTAANIALGSNFLSGDGDDEGISIDSSGAVGIGTTTPDSRLVLEVDSFSGAGTAGLSQWLTTTNSVASAVQYGSRFDLDANNTATTTIVGNLLRVEDDTAFGNTTRGLEVQTNRGSNTLGENTAISGTGGTFEPAGGFFQTRGTTQGNAIRGFSSSITSASLMSLFHDTSSFTGTGLEMNFGNSGGSFANDALFADFRNTNTSVFTVTGYGTTTIGDGTNQAGLQIGLGGLCVDNDGSCSASTTGQIASVSSYTGNSDLAEMYFSSQSLETGEIVTLAGDLSVRRAVPGVTEPIIGVVSTKPGLLLGFDDTSTRAGEIGYPVALSGRVPIQLSTENGPVERGDYLMLSSIPGVAMKATATGTIVGIALEDFDESRMYSRTFINQFGDDMVDPVYQPVTDPDDPRVHDGCYYGGGGDIGEPCVPLDGASIIEQINNANQRLEEESVADQLAALAATPSETRIVDGRAVSVGQVIMFVDLRERFLAPEQSTQLASLLALPTEQGENEEETILDRLVVMANSFVDGVLTLAGIRAERIEVAEELCVDDVCVDANDLRNLLENVGGETAAAATGNTEPATEEPMYNGGSNNAGNIDNAST